MTTSWTDISPSATTWADVSADTAHYKTDKLGRLYAGFKGGLVAGALTIAGVAFYAGYIGTEHGATSYTGISPSTTSWDDVTPTTTDWNDVSV